VRQPAGDEHVSPVKSKQLDLLVEPAQVASCGEDECLCRSENWVTGPDVRFCAMPVGLPEAG
jgi:hypothetical protein